MPRNIEEIESDIDKLTDLMKTLAMIAREGYTIRQRIAHHEEMAALLKAKIVAQGGTYER